MVYLIACPDATLAVSIARTAIKKEYPVRDEFNFVSFNMASTSLLELTQEAEFLPLGYEKKAILAKDCSFLSKPARGAKKASVEGLEDLQHYLENPSDSTDLFLLVYDDKVDEKSPLVQAIKKNGSIQIEKAPDEAFLRKAMENYLKKRGLTIEESAAKELLVRAGDDYQKFSNELRKLEAYANGETIRLEAVKLLVSGKPEESVFAISDNLLRGDVKKALSVYYDLVKNGFDEITLIGALGSQLRFLDQVSYLDAKDKSSHEIGMILNVPEWRVAKSLRTIYGVPQETIIHIMEQLYEADKAILSGATTPEFAFTRFLANFSLE